MANNALLLSLCIPTNGKVEWIIPVIESIYEQEVDNSLFEVVITDNGEKSDLEKEVKRFNYGNFHYYRTKAQGFTNQIDAFEKCSGLFCKMLNHRSRLLPGSINKMIALIERYQDYKPILYFAEGKVEGGDVIECKDIDSFVNKQSYYVSWSAGTGAWRDDLTDLRNKKIDRMFPHTVFLFELRNDSRYVIWNEKYEVMGDESGKGGYDLFYTFGVGFLDIISGLRMKGRIRTETFIKVKKDLLSFLRDLYLSEVILPTNRTFILQNIPQSIDVYYGRMDYWRLVLGAWMRCPLAILKRIYHMLFS